MKTSKIGYWAVEAKILETVKKLVLENKLFEIMQMFPDEWNICSGRLSRINVSDHSITFIDRGISTSEGVRDASWGIKV